MKQLANPEAEECAKQIAGVIDDKVKRQEIFSAFLEKHPKLKRWEGHAIAERAIYIAREAALSQAEKRANQ